MATTIDIPCPKCGELVMCDSPKGIFHDLMFFQFMRSSFRVDCSCGFKKTYRFISAEALEKMYLPSEPKKTESNKPTTANDLHTD